jgi:hypothetical protein
MNATSVRRLLLGFPFAICYALICLIRHNLFNQMKATMNESLFDSPVFVKDGTYLIREIASIDDAIDFLYEWPENERDLIYQITWTSCLASKKGITPIKDAENAMRRFASDRCILENPDITIL